MMTHDKPKFYIDPNGSDANPGTEALPWATLGHAKEQLGSDWSEASQRTSGLMLKGGTYRCMGMKQTLEAWARARQGHTHE